MADLWDSSCVWESPLKTSRWAPGSELETPHLTYSDISSGEIVAPPQNSGDDWNYTVRMCECAPWCQLQFSILSHQTTWDFKRPFMSFLCVCISSSPQTVNPPACLFNIKPKWSIAKHWSMKSKPLIYPCFKTTVIFFPFSFSVAFVHC